MGRAAPSLPGALVLALLLGAGCAVDEPDGLLRLVPEHAEPSLPGCRLVGEEDTDGNGFTDRATTIDHDELGRPVRSVEAETDNGGEPPAAPDTFRLDTEFDGRDHPLRQEEGPDDASPRTVTAWSWDYGGSGYEERAEVDRRDDGEDLTLWTLRYDPEGQLATWDRDERAVGGRVERWRWTWSGGEAVELEASHLDEAGDEHGDARWRLERDGLGRLLRRVELLDGGQEGREAVFERDDRGHVLLQRGAWDARDRWSDRRIAWSSDCY